MKRILYILLVLTVAFSILGSTVAYASGAAEEVESEAPETDAKEVNLFTRLYEAFVDNKTDIFTLGGSAVLFVISLLLKKDVGATSKSIVDNIARVLSKADVSDAKQTAIVNGLNAMVDDYNEMKNQSGTIQEKLSDFAADIERITGSNRALEAKINDVFSVMLSLMNTEISQNNEVMELLASVYTNNGALPQGTKDFVTLLRTENAKLVQDASELIRASEGASGE